MGFTLLPNETLFAIASYLPDSSLPSFAQANSATYKALNKLSQRVLRYRHNRAAIIRRFGKPALDYGCTVNPSTYISENDFLDAVFDEPDEKTLADLEYLELNGDLHWLRPLPEEIQATNCWGVGKAAQEDEIARLIEQAKDVGVEIPSAFIKFMSSQELIERMYLGGDYFSLGPGLVKCRPTDDKEAGGYLIRFLCDQQWCGFWALYLAPGGEHCVLSLRVDVHCSECEYRDQYAASLRKEMLEGEVEDLLINSEVEQQVEDRLEHPQPVTHKGIPLCCYPVDEALAHTDFEEWLCMRYFAGWISATLHEEDQELNSRQQEYLVHYWPKKELKEEHASLGWAIEY